MSSTISSSSSSSSSKLILRVYKHLLRLGTKFDTNSYSKLLIYRKKLNPISTVAAFSADGRGGRGVYYNRLLDTILTETGNMYPPLSNFSLRKFIADEFRCSLETISVSERIDVAFVAIKKLTLLWNIFSSSIVEQSSSSSSTTRGASTKKRSEEESITVNDAITVSPCKIIQAGCLLVAHPLIHGPLHRAIILVLDHNENGTYGIVINKYTDYNISQAVRNLPKDVLRVIGDYKVNFGGNVRRLQYVHNVAGCGGIPISFCSKDNNLYAGGQITTIMSSLKKSSKEKKEKILFFVGCCTWDFGSLDSEIDAGYWIPITTQTDLILDKFSFSKPVKSSSNDASSMHQSKSTEVSNNTSSIYQKRNSMWSFLFSSLKENPGNTNGFPFSQQVSGVDSAEHDWI